MKKTYRPALFLVLLTLAFGGCGAATGQADPQPAAADQGVQETQASQSADAASKEASSASETAAPDQLQPEQTPVKDELAGAKKVKVTADKPLDFNDWVMDVRGFEELKKLKGDYYTDKPAKGKVYLVLYMKMQNDSEKEHLVAPECVKATVDSEEVSTTYLVNSPHKYSTLYQLIPPDEKIAGYFVWEVPKKWKKFKFTYTGAAYDNHVIPYVTLTHKDLFQPKEYDEKQIY